MVGRGGTVRCKKRTPLPMRAQVAIPGQHILASECAELLQCTDKLLVFRVHHRVGAIRRHHPSLPTAGGNRCVVVQGIQRRFGGGDHLDIEALEQRSRQEARRLQRSGDVIVIMVGGAAIETNT